MRKSISENTSAKITWLHFICCMLIVGIHSTGYHDFNNYNDAIKYSLDYLQLFAGRTAMCMFFFLSGLLFFKDYYENTSFCTWYKKKLSSRVRSLLVPYIIWNTLYFFIAILLSIIPRISSRLHAYEVYDWTFGNIIKGILLYHYDQHFWYMYVLIIYVVISPFLLFCLHDKKTGILALIAFYLVSVLPISEKISFFEVFQGDASLFFYSLGGYLSIHYFNIVNWGGQSRRITILSTLALMVSQGLGFVFYEMNIPNCVIYIFKFVSLVALWILMNNCRARKISWIFECTFLIYAAHPLLEVIIDKIIRRLVIDSSGTVLLVFFGGAFLSIVGVLTIVKIMRRFAPKTLSILNGGRAL